jgi:hypothetical protein
MTMIVPKKEDETRGEVRERVSRITKRQVPDWWAKAFPSDATVKGKTPLARKPDEEEKDVDS